MPKKIFHNLMLCLVLIGLPLLSGCGGNPAPTPAPDPIPTNFWTAKANMPTARANLTAAELNDKIYAFGGLYSSSAGINRVEVYDPATNTWATTKNLPTARGYLIIS